jgi:hypothetical protein|tara:strand:+ start:1439 stop:1774 length:336 start_codon:yes stop_codon:yes gene_type:complete
MNELTSMLDNVKIDELEPILLQIIDSDFNKITDFFINREVDFCIEPDPIHEYYLNSENCKRIYDYLVNNSIGYILLKSKMLLINEKYKIFELIEDDDIKTYVDYYLQFLNQ